MRNKQHHFLGPIIALVLGLTLLILSAIEQRTDTSAPACPNGASCASPAIWTLIFRLGIMILVLTAIWVVVRTILNRAKKA